RRASARPASGWPVSEGCVLERWRVGLAGLGAGGGAPDDVVGGLGEGWALGFGCVAEDDAEGAGELEDAVFELPHGPCGGVLHRVVAPAQVREVADGGRAACGPVLGVVDVGAVDGVVAAGPAAAAVAGAQPAPHGPVGLVGVDRDRHAGDG